MLSLLLGAVIAPASAAEGIATGSISGTITDPQGAVVARAELKLLNSANSVFRETKTNNEGYYEFRSIEAGNYRLAVDAPGFAEVNQKISVLPAEATTANIQLLKLVGQTQEVRVVASEPAALTPDPSQRILIHGDVLEANPGHPGAPVSIPGLPIETASGGIKAPQYFAPGVAGDHGEPIAQFYQVGDFLYPNNLPANAHGNGYADPNFLISRGIGTVQTDGGAFNVREGNHAINLAVTYGPRPRLETFLQLTGDPRDFDLVAGWSPAKPDIRGWVAVEAAYGNGFLDRLEHRRQFKLNAYRAATLGRHELTLFGIGYYGFSFLPGLIPRDIIIPNDTIDPRQSDRTHTALVVGTDTWHATEKQQLQFSGFFRTYNLALRSNFGEGLIQQSEFRTVAGGNVTYVYKVRPEFSLLAGLDLRRDAPRNLDLQHADSNGSFRPVASNDLTLRFVAPFVAVDGALSPWFHYDLGIRREEVSLDNVDKINPTNSFNQLAGITLAKGTLTVLPPTEIHLPVVAFSFGEAFHTSDPRIGQGTGRGTILAASHATQLVARENAKQFEFKITLARVTNAQELAKIDPDTGLQRDVGPSVVKSVTLSVRRSFSFGFLQASWARANAQNRNTGDDIPEAPRLIWDVVGGMDRLPLGMRARVEYEAVGKKPLGDGFTAIPVREFRGALLRSFGEGRMEVGFNFLVASGYTGQTLETLQLSGEPAPFERVVGVPLKSYLSVTWTYNFRRRGSASPSPAP